jgi:hypothetical protein
VKWTGESLACRAREALKDGAQIHAPVEQGLPLPEVAVGLCGRAPAPQDHVRFLAARWADLKALRLAPRRPRIALALYFDDVYNVYYHVHKVSYVTLMYNRKAIKSYPI